MKAEDLFEPDRTLALAEAEALAREHFGFDGKAEQLWGERDQNFKLETAGGERALLKVSHSAEDRVVTNLQTAMIAHVAAKDPGLPLPHLRPSRTGDLETVWTPRGEAPRVLRMMAFLPSDKQEGPLNSAQLTDLGECAARLDRALIDFRHPGEDQDLLWDLQKAGRLRTFAGDIEDPAIRALALEALSLFERRALPAYPRLRRQAIHNDLNPGNVLFQGDRVSAIIDFGDAVRAPLVQELAVICAYHVRAEPDPLAAPRTILVAYERFTPCTDDEHEVLPAAIAGRLAMGLLVGAYRARNLPLERESIASSLPAVAGRLAALLRALKTEPAL